MIGTITGRYGDTGNCPYVQALITLPRLGISGAISFIFDTGCDQTLLMPIDGDKLGIEYAKLGAGVSSLSASGEMETSSERAVIIFRQPRKNRIFVYDLNIAIAVRKEGVEEIPSLLGRDIISRWSSTVVPSKKFLRCRVLSADFTKTTASKKH